MVIHSTGNVKRDLVHPAGCEHLDRQWCTGRDQGVQELDLIAEVVRREVQRQQNLLEIRNGLRSRGASVSRDKDVTDLFRDTRSAVLKKAKKIRALTLKGFADLVGRGDPTGAPSG